MTQKPEWFRVNASTEVCGHKPGKRFKGDDLDPVQKARLLAGGAIVEDTPPPSTKSKASPEPDPSE